MEALVWTLIVLGDLAAAACAVHLARRHRRGPAQLVRSINRAAPVLLAAGLLPLSALLAADASAAAWGLWGATTITAALVYAYADTLRDLPPHARTASPTGSGP
ncbi:hypothetical protein O3Q52_11165 [Streptomyces sp. ActVer]|uniref:hypothetical protein n=1 Tax=Streptomyces sp. ActVer TaxID=3014558 RepID=UPI0022B2C4E0|nr:hypothetical protein [Streptomyces sp. ActVer]MCZ4508754.1 hypothetical protein [Streptomyces sp. ActVer]